MPVKCGTTAIKSMQNGTVARAYVANSLVFQKMISVEYNFSETGSYTISEIPSGWTNIYIDIKGAGGGGGLNAGQSPGDGGAGGGLTCVSLDAKQISLLAGENGSQGEEGYTGPGGGGAGGQDGENAGSYATGGKGGEIQIDPGLQSYLLIDRNGGGAGGKGDGYDQTSNGNGGNGGRVYGIIHKSALPGLSSITIRVGEGGYHWNPNGCGENGSVFIKIY